MADTRLLAAAYVLLSLVGLAGLSIGSVPLGVDFPNHAARLFIECNPDDPVLSRMYMVDYGLIPNLAIDLINRPLCGLVDPMTVVRGSMIAGLAGILILVWKLHRFINDGRPNAFVLLAPAMSFNIITSMGYVNYLIGTFVFLLLAWAMLRFRLLERHPAIAILVANLCGALIFFCHIFALALAGLLIFGMRFAAERRHPLLRRFFQAALMSAVSFALPFLMMLLAERSGFGVTYAVAGKLRTVIGPLLYTDGFAAFYLTAAWLALFFWAFREKFLTFAQPLRTPLMLMAAFVLVLPSALLDAVDVDSRILASIAFLAVAALRSPCGAVPLHTQFAAALLGTITLGVQLGLALPQMREYEEQVAEFRSALDVIAPNGSVISVINVDRAHRIPNRFYAHLASFSTRDRKAFNPLEFTGKGMQPLVVTAAFACLDARAGSPLSVRSAGQLQNPEAGDIFLSEREHMKERYAYLWPKRFNYLVYYHFGNAASPFPAELRPLRKGSFFTIFQTRTGSTNGPCVGASRVN